MTARIGRYDTLGILGGGGMATVYVGRAVAAGGFERLVAIKVMHPHLAMNPEFVAMFLDEARLAARIRHPNVVATIDLQHGDHDAFLVMEYVEGPSLDALLGELRKRGERLPLDVALRVFLDLLAGLHAAHETTGPDGKPLGLVHRDVSPHNVLVGTDGVARITDFGVALAVARLASTKFGHVKGKIAYAPPEQVLLEPLDRRADVYAAGAVLWEILAGKPLFESDNELTLGGLVLDGAKQSPREVAGVPEAISDVCMRALRPERGERFATAADFADALEAAADAAGVRVATARAVASYVKQLGVHRPAPDGTAAPSRASFEPIASTGNEPTLSSRRTARFAAIGIAGVAIVVVVAAIAFRTGSAPGATVPASAPPSARPAAAASSAETESPPPPAASPASAAPSVSETPPPPSAKPAPPKGRAVVPPPAPRRPTPGSPFRPTDL